MGARILVADDSVTIQKVVELTFSKENFQIVPARSGEEAIRKAREVRPDLMLIDLVMPDKSGYEVCETLRKDPALKDVPIILLTGTFEAFDRNEGVRVGANDFVTKPFESQLLIGKVKQLLFSRSATAAPAPPPPASPAPGPAFGPPPLELERDVPGLPSPAPSIAPAPSQGGEAEVSEEKLWELLEREEPAGGSPYVLPEPSGPGLPLGPPVEEARPPSAPPAEGEPVFSLDETTDVASTLKDMAASLGLSVEGGRVDLEGPAPPAAAPPAPAAPAPAEDLAIPLLESLEILPDLEPAAAPAPPPAPTRSAPPPAPATHPMDTDRVTREITEKVTRALVQEVSERLAGKIERIVWEVVPDLAEHLITQEIERIKAQAEGPPEKA
ncbi:MAG: response regulator [candidate division NC10 bacterium]|nr:response regulator [candidate division NC10 bacterium]